MSAPHGTPAVPTTGRERPVAVAVIFALFGGFVWLVVGVVGYNAVAGFGPRVTERAEILSVEVERSRTGSSTTRPSLWVEGETESGRTWRMASDEAYDAATRLGYPMDVEVVISTWTGNTLAVRGDGFDVDRTGRGLAVVWVAATVIALAGALALGWLLARKQSLTAAAAYLVLSPLWVWLGFLLMRAYRT